MNFLKGYIYGSTPKFKKTELYPTFRQRYFTVSHLVLQFHCPLLHFATVTVSSIEYNNGKSLFATNYVDCLS